MKKLATCILTLVLISTLPGTGHASNAPLRATAPISEPIKAEESTVLLSRLDEINAMDKSELNSSEKRELRKEVKSIQARLSNGGGVYISAGGIIIILLLLIILL